MKRTLALAAAIAACLVAPTSQAVAADAHGCDKYASTAPGSTITTPQQLHDALAAGETGCFEAGTYTTTNLNITKANTTFKSFPGARAVWRGRIVIQANNVTIRDLRLDGSYGPCLDCNTGSRHSSPVIGATNAKILNNDISNRREAGSPAPTAGICINESNTGVDVTGYLIENNRIHDCGRLPASNHDHGIYMGSSGLATGGTIRNNVLFDNADRGLQLFPAARGASVSNNTIDGNGQGYNVNDSSRDNVLTDNIITNSTIRWNMEAPSLSGTGNQVNGVCLRASNSNSFYNTDNGIETGFRSAVSVTGDTTAPSNVYADRANKDFRRANGCSGMGAPDSVAEEPASDASSNMAALDSCGAVQMKQGGPEQSWSGQVTGCGSRTLIAAGGQRIAFLAANGDFYAKENPSAGWGLVATGVADAAITSNTMIVVAASDGAIHGKSGAFNSPWIANIGPAGTKKAIALAGERVAFINGSDELWGKESFSDGWGLVQTGAKDVALTAGPSRMLSVATNGQVNGKNGAFNSPWIGNIVGANTPVTALEMAGTRMAVSLACGEVSTKEDWPAPSQWIVVAPCGHGTGNNGRRELSMSEGRLAFVDYCGGVLTKDLTTTKSLNEPLVRQRDCGDALGVAVSR